MKQRFTWKKNEKLKSRKRIDRLFKEGKSFSVFPYRVYYMVHAAGLSGVSAPDGTGQDVAAPAVALPVPQPPAPGETIAAAAPAATPSSTFLPAAVQAGFGAGSRHFKKAVDRNRIKRLGREAYRLQKGPLLEQIKAKNLTMTVFFIYTGKELPEYRLVSEKIGVVLQKLIKETV